MDYKVFTRPEESLFSGGIIVKDVTASLNELGIEEEGRYALARAEDLEDMLRRISADGPAPAVPEAKRVRNTDSDTQKLAALAIAPHAHKTRGRLLTALCRNPTPHTDEELCEMADPPVKLNGGSRRCGELVDGGWAVVTGTKKGSSGMPKKLYAPTPKALEEWDY